MIDESLVLETIRQNPDIPFVRLAKKLRIEPRDNRKLTAVLIELLEKNLIINNRKKSTYTALEKISEEVGTIKFVGEGKFAFVDTDKTDEEGSVVSFFVPRPYYNKAFHQDIVKIGVYKPCDKENNRSFGIVEEIVERGKYKIIGVLDVLNNFTVFKPIDEFLKSTNFKIQNCINEARVLDIVVAEIVEHKNNHKVIDIVEKITNVNDPMAYVKSLEVSRNVPQSFPEHVMDYARNNIPKTIENEDLSKRLDLRNELIVTIDGAGTKDFDDAISVKKLDNGSYKLGVHIADVAYYVKKNSPIDIEALNRGTSIYLLDKVVPMLPVQLSNGICSLNPGVDRLTISCIMTIDKNGKTTDVKITPSVIKSKHRLTYEKVNEFIENTYKFEENDLNEMLSHATKLSRILREHKIKEGYIDFEINEPKIVLDIQGRVIDIVPEETGESEMIIEDFMVRANEEVAKFITKKKLPMIYRIHEIPNDEKVDYLINVLKLLNININIKNKELSPLEFQKIVDEVNSGKDDDFLKMLFLRTMQKAIYSPDNIGHFGLASKCYCHFTSPIRRYPDVIVHRILWEFVFKNNRFKIKEFASELEQIATMSSSAEQNAVQLEWDVNDLKFAEYYKSKINSEYRGQISTITKFGMFIQFENKTVAMVHVSNIGDGNFAPNAKFTELINSENEKEKYKLGQFVNVTITNADETTGKVDCVLSKDYKQYLKRMKSDLMKRRNRRQGKND